MEDKAYIELNDEQLRAYQLKCLEIVKDIHKYCEEKGLSYSLSGGSILGAIRHKGFIPWDDDIDLFMPRADYDKFIEGFEQEYGEKYYIQTPMKYPQLGLLVTQIRMEGTIARRKYDWNIDKCGISIDVYIWENVYDNAIKRKWQTFRCLFLPFIVSACRTYNNRKLSSEIIDAENREVKYKFWKRVIGFLAHLIPMRIWIKKTCKAFSMCKNNESTLVSAPSGRFHFSKEIRERQSVLSFVKVPFEDTMFYIPKDYDGYLKNLYGDYMTIPPEGKREKHVFLELKY